MIFQWFGEAAYLLVGQMLCPAKISMIYIFFIYSTSTTDPAIAAAKMAPSEITMVFAFHQVTVRF